eukprot:jgi/Mesvir1/3904/Mv19849-RA.2
MSHRFALLLSNGTDIDDTSSSSSSDTSTAGSGPGVAWEIVPDSWLLAVPAEPASDALMSSSDALMSSSTSVPHISAMGADATDRDGLLQVVDASHGSGSFSRLGRALDVHVPKQLPDFEVEGPLELVFPVAVDLRLSLPHRVDAGLVRRVMIAQGARVVVQGATRTSLRRPVEVPLPALTTLGPHSSPGAAPSPPQAPSPARQAPSPQQAGAQEQEEPSSPSPVPPDALSRVGTKSPVGLLAFSRAVRLQAVQAADRATASAPTKSLRQMASSSSSSSPPVPALPVVSLLVESVQGIAIAHAPRSHLAPGRTRTAPSSPRLKARRRPDGVLDILPAQLEEKGQEGAATTPDSLGVPRVASGFSLWPLPGWRLDDPHTAALEGVLRGLLAEGAVRSRANSARRGPSPSSDGAAGSLRLLGLESAVVSLVKVRYRVGEGRGRAAGWAGAEGAEEPMEASDGVEEDEAVLGGVDGQVDGDGEQHSLPVLGAIAKRVARLLDAQEKGPRRWEAVFMLSPDGEVGKKGALKAVPVDISRVLPPPPTITLSHSTVYGNNTGVTTSYAVPGLGLRVRTE